MMPNQALFLFSGGGVGGSGDNPLHPCIYLSLEAQPRLLLLLLLLLLY